jgi:Protein of unknown function (DUF2442)
LRGQELARIARLVREHRDTLRERGMTSSAHEIWAPPLATAVVVTDEQLLVELSDGRSLGVPLAWFPRLFHATAVERVQWRLIGNDEGIHWDAVDEDVSIEDLLAGRGSQESQGSLRRWLASRGTA